MQQGNKCLCLKNYFLLLSLLLVLLSGCGSSSPSVTKAKAKPKPTPTAIPDNGERFYLNTATSLAQYRTLDGHQLWSWNDDSQANNTTGGFSDLTIGNEMAYMNVPTSGNYHIVAFDINTGKKVWQTPFNYATTFILDGKVLYVGSGTNVYGVNTSNGQATWEVPISSNENINFMFLQGTTLYVSNKYAIFAFDTRTHSQIWTYSMNQLNVFDEINNLWVDGNSLVVATAQNISGFDAHTGKFLWIADMTVVGYTSDTQAHTVQVVTSAFRDTPNNGKAGLLTIQTNNGGGTVSWNAQFSVNPDSIEQIKFTNDSVFIAQNNVIDSQIVVLSLKDGHKEWTADAAPPVNGVRTTSSSETVAVLRVTSNVVYAVMNDGFIYTFDVTSGKLLWNKGLLAVDVLPVESADQTSTELYTFGKAATADANQTSAPNQGYVAKLNPQTGNVIWQSNADIAVYFPMQVNATYVPSSAGTVTSQDEPTPTHE